MKKLLQDLIDFHRAGDVPVLLTPQIPPPDRVKLRRDLLEEEFFEFLKASDAGDLVEIADALGDIIYIAVGTALEYGIPLDRVWDEIQRSNMAKVDKATNKMERRPDGKILKPEGWTPPDIETALRVR